MRNFLGQRSGYNWISEGLSQDECNVLLLSETILQELNARQEFRHRPWLQHRSDCCRLYWWDLAFTLILQLRKTLTLLLKYFFLAPFGCLYYFLLFCHHVVHLIHQVFRQTRELNSRPRTMAQTVSPRCSPLDQGASPKYAYSQTEKLTTNGPKNIMICGFNFYFLHT